MARSTLKQIVKKPSFIVGIILVGFGMFLPIAVAFASQEVYKLVFGELTKIALFGNELGNVLEIATFLGFVSIGWSTLSRLIALRKEKSNDNE